MMSTKVLSARTLVAAPVLATLMLSSGCGSSENAPTTTVDAPATTTGADGGAGVELEPGSNLPPDETPDVSASPNDTMSEGTPGPNDEGVPDAGGDSGTTQP
jgi:hypothetical protein